MARSRPRRSAAHARALAAANVEPLAGPARWFIDGGMTSGIPDASARARTITVYTNLDKALDNLGLAGTDTIAVLIVERSGRIFARETGGFEEQKAQRLAAMLAPARDRARAPGARPAADLLPRRNGGRVAERVLPHPALPRPTTTSDDRASLP